MKKHFLKFLVVFIFLTEDIVISFRPKTSGRYENWAENEVGDEPRKCPVAFTEIGGRCYFYGYFKLNWFRAMEFCHSFGTTVSLACIETKQENEHLKEWLLEHGDHSTGVWVGGSDNGHIGRWAWFPTGQLIRNFNWGPSQPSGGDQHCMYIVGGYLGYQWADFHCGFEMTFLCEHDVNPIQAWRRRRNMLPKGSLFEFEDDDANAILWNDDEAILNKTNKQSWTNSNETGIQENADEYLSDMKHHPNAQVRNQDQTNNRIYHHPSKYETEQDNINQNYGLDRNAEIQNNYNKYYDQSNNIVQTIVNRKMPNRTTDVQNTNEQTTKRNRFDNKLDEINNKIFEGLQSDQKLKDQQQQSSQSKVLFKIRKNGFDWQENLKQDQESKVQTEVKHSLYTSSENQDRIVFSTKPQNKNSIVISTKRRFHDNSQDKPRQAETEHPTTTRNPIESQTSNALNPPLETTVEVPSASSLDNWSVYNFLKNIVKTG